MDVEKTFDELKDSSNNNFKYGLNLKEKAMLVFIINWILGYCLLVVVTLLVKAFQIGTANNNRSSSTPSPNFLNRTGGLWQGRLFWILFVVSPLLGAMRLVFGCCYKKYYEPLREDTQQSGPLQQNITSQTNLSGIRNSYAMDDSKQAVDGNEYNLDPKSVGIIESWLSPNRGSNPLPKISLKRETDSSNEIQSASFGLGDEFNTIDPSLDSINKTIEDGRMNAKSGENTSKGFIADESPGDSSQGGQTLDSTEPKNRALSSTATPILTRESETIDQSQRSGLDRPDEDLGSDADQGQEAIKLKWEKKKQEMIEERRLDRANERKRQREQRKAKALPRKLGGKDAEKGRKDGEGEVNSDDEKSRGESPEKLSGLQGDEPI